LRRVQDAFDAITAVIPWERFRASVAEAEALARPEDFDSYEMLGEHYATMRRWASAFLATFSFQGVPAVASLLRAVDMLRNMSETAAPRLPKSAPTGFIRERWARYVMPGGVLDRRYYELCVLSELRGRLRAGDVWVVGSRRYRSFEERLVSPGVLQELLQSGTLPVSVDPDFERFIASRRALLDARLAVVEAKAKGGLLPDVSLDRGVLKIAPIEKSTPPDAEALAARLYAMLPRIRITDLRSEVARWTLFTDCFTHLRSGETVADPRILMAGLLADGLNLGLTRMAEPSASSPGSPTGIFATKLMPSPCDASSIISSESRWRRYSAVGLLHRRTGSSFGPAASGAMPAASTPITVTFPEANSIRTSPTATRRSTPR
jgi:hypothetical protein